MLTTLVWAYGFAYLQFVQVGITSERVAIPLYFLPKGTPTWIIECKRELFAPAHRVDRLLRPSVWELKPGDGR